MYNALSSFRSLVQSCHTHLPLISEVPLPLHIIFTPLSTFVDNVFPHHNAHLQFLLSAKKFFTLPTKYCTLVQHHYIALKRVFPSVSHWCNAIQSFPFLTDSLSSFTVDRRSSLLHRTIFRFSLYRRYCSLPFLAFLSLFLIISKASVTCAAQTLHTTWTPLRGCKGTVF